MDEKTSDLCDGCDSTANSVEATDDGRALLCADCRGMSGDLSIPEEAEEFRFSCADGCGRQGYAPEGLPLIVAAELDRLAHGLHERALADRVRALDAEDPVSRATYKHRADGYDDAWDALNARASVLRGEGDRP